MQAKFRHGNPLMVDYTPSGAVAAGDVVVIGSVPFVAHNAIAADKLGALAARGGVYRGVGTNGVTEGEEVFWDDTANTFEDANTAPSGSPHFGYACPGQTAGNPTGEIDVIHAPNGTTA